MLQCDTLSTYFLDPDDTNFGPTPKTVLEEITAILKEYADGSNILKVSTYTSV